MFGSLLIHAPSLDDAKKNFNAAFRLSKFSCMSLGAKAETKEDSLALDHLRSSAGEDELIVCWTCATLVSFHHCAAYLNELYPHPEMARNLMGYPRAIDYVLRSSQLMKYRVDKTYWSIFNSLRVEATADEKQSIRAMIQTPNAGDFCMFAKAFGCEIARMHPESYSYYFEIPRFVLRELVLQIQHNYIESITNARTELGLH